MFIDKKLDAKCKEWDVNGFCIDNLIYVSLNQISDNTTNKSDVPKRIAWTISHEFLHWIVKKTKSELTSKALDTRFMRIRLKHYLGGIPNEFISDFKKDIDIKRAIEQYRIDFAKLKKTFPNLKED